MLNSEREDEETHKDQDNILQLSCTRFCVADCAFASHEQYMSLWSCSLTTRTRENKKNPCSDTPTVVLPAHLRGDVVVSLQGGALLSAVEALMHELFVLVRLWALYAFS